MVVTVGDKKKIIKVLLELLNKGFCDPYLDQPLFGFEL